jgi:hypothetical protein
MIKLYISLFISTVFCFALTLKSEAQKCYVQNQSLSIHNNGVIAVFDDIILDSAHISGQGTLLLAKKGIQKITACHSNIDNLKISAETTLKITGDLKISNITKLEILQTPTLNDLHKDVAIALESKKKIEEKPRVENQPIKSGIRPNYVSMYGLLSANTFKIRYYEKSFQNFIKLKNFYTLRKPDTDYSPPEYV